MSLQQHSQLDVFPGFVAGASPPAWSQLLVPPQQAMRLHAGDARYIDDFITPAQEEALLDAVADAPWRNDLQRRVQHYGYRYDYAERDCEANRLGALPKWSDDVCMQLVQRRIFATPPSQLIVNEYEPGQGIAPHTDRDCFGPVVASLSLGGDCMMQLFPHAKDKHDAFEIVLSRRSLLVLQGASRNAWRHGIARRKSDVQYGRKIPRGYRVSLTFRTLNTGVW